MSAEVAEYANVAKRVLEDKDAPGQPLGELGGVLVGEFKQAVEARRETERRWLKDLRQYRGQYDPEVLAKIGANRSKAFLRKTRVKVKTVDSRVADMLFPAGVEKNWGIEPTPKPSLSQDQKIEIRQLLVSMAQGATITREMFDKAVLDWAKKRSARMSTTIEDQLSEVNYKRNCRLAIHSGNLYGTGVLKGPLIERKVRTRFVKNGDKWVPQSESYVVPFVEYVPLWRFYPDMTSTDLQHCRYVYERHMMTKAGMSDLALRRSFRRDAIIEYIKANPNGRAELEFAETELRSIGERGAIAGDPGGKYEVLERWGYLDGQQLRDAGVDVPEDRLHESFFSNVWLMPDGKVIKAVLQPINGVTWPYHLYYFDKDESSIFGEGLATVMRDDQTMMNAATRLMIDNAAISAGAQIEVNPHLLSSHEKIDEVNPWKVWLRNNTSPGSPAVRVHEIPSRTAELSGMVGRFENNADEVSAVPRYMTGENATSGAAGTSSGLSMLIGNVNIVIKDLVSNWDEGITVSFIRGMYHWNMQFNPDDAIKGDFDAVATATASLVAKEVKARQLNELAALTANEFDAPYIKRDVLNRKRAEANELVDCVKTEEEVTAEMNSEAAKTQAQMQQMAQQLAMAEAKAKVDKLIADAEATRAQAQQTLANIDLLIAKTVATKVEAAYAALQAGGTATASPYIAPAGDEILRSAGWKDATPDPSIAQLNTTPVQAEQGTHQLLNKGQTFVEQPRGVDEARPDSAVADLEPQTGMVGRREGIETQEIEAA